MSKLFFFFLFKQIQVEEKTVAHSTTTSATRQEKRTVTQEMKSTTTLLPEAQVIIEGEGGGKYVNFPLGRQYIYKMKFFFFFCYSNNIPMKIPQVLTPTIPVRTLMITKSVAICSLIQILKIK